MSQHIDSIEAYAQPRKRELYKPFLERFLKPVLSYGSNSSQTWKTSGKASGNTQNRVTTALRHTQIVTTLRSLTQARPETSEEAQTKGL
jgi:hypothetical protein